MGFEAMCVHRVWRGLAVQLASAGMPTLRFDYHGTGDSDGGDEDPGRVKAWIDSIHAAVATLRERAGVEEVALVGLRLGALLATRAACEEDGIEALVLLAPPISGRAYAREFKAMSLLRRSFPNEPAPQPDSAGDLEAGGHLLNADAIDDLKVLDLRQLGRAPAARVLVMPRPDSAAEAQLAPSFRSLGAMVREEPFTGYGELMRDVILAKSPRAAFDVVTGWLGERPPRAEATASLRSTAPARARPGRARLELTDAVEEPVWIDADPSLFGILCKPRRACADRPVILLLNTGANHHIGANRLAVTLARRLAGLGFTSLRFDVAGIGDSPGRQGARHQPIYAEDPIDDVRRVAAWLAHRGYRRYTALGLCSGAYVAFHAAVREPGLTGLVLVNLQRFVWREGDQVEIAAERTFHGTGFYRAKLFDVATWQRILEGRVDVAGIARLLTSHTRKRLAASMSELAGRRHGSAGERRRIVQGFVTLAERGVRTLLLYSATDGGLDERDLYLGRGGRKLRGLAGVRQQLIEGADHTFSARWAREHVFQVLAAHLTEEDTPPHPHEQATGH